MQTKFTEEEFSVINNDINDLCEFYKVSGSNGQLSILLTALSHYFQIHNISQIAYWQYITDKNVGKYPIEDSGGLHNKIDIWKEIEKSAQKTKKKIVC